MGVLRRDIEIKPDALEGLAVQSWEQNQGRGRHGNIWYSPKGNLYISICFFPQKNMIDFGQMAFVVALALRDSYWRYNIDQDRIKLKWPNDILIDDKKAAGLLLEAGKDASGRDFLILGAGVNIYIAPQDRIALDDVCDLPKNHLENNIIAFRDVFLELLAQYYQKWHEGDFETLKNEWLKTAAFLGKEITVRCANETRKGVFKGIDNNGALLLRGNDGKTTKVLSGEVFF